MTTGAFKKRFSNHKKSLNNIHYFIETVLSKYAWILRQSEREFTKVVPSALNYFQNVVIAINAARINLVCERMRLCTISTHKQTVKFVYFPNDRMKRA